MSITSVASRQRKESLFGMRLIERVVSEWVQEGGRSKAWRR